MTDQMSQSGFSAVIHKVSILHSYIHVQRPLTSGSSIPLCALTWHIQFCFQDALILGSVGSNRWRGSLQEIKKQEETQIKDSDMQEDSYMGNLISLSASFKMVAVNNG